MDDTYFFLVELLQPYTLCLLLAALALGYVWWRTPDARRRLRWLILPFVALVLLSLPVLSHLALESLERPYPPLRERPPQAQAIVVLAGGLRFADADQNRAELAPDTLYRCIHGIELYHQGGHCPILVSGGPIVNDPKEPACAEAMRIFLTQMGVSSDDILVEAESRTTYENAVYSREILERQGIHRIVLVTDATHMFRAEHCFRKQGLEVIPSGCNQRARPFQWSLLDFVPRAYAVEDIQDVAHEWLGTLWYWSQGRI